MDSRRSGGVDATHEEGKAREVVDEAFHADFGFGAGDSDGANVAAVHGIGDVAENMLAACAHVGFFGVGGFLCFGERLTAIGALMNMRHETRLRTLAKITFT